MCVQSTCENQGQSSAWTKYHKHFVLLTHLVIVALTCWESKFQQVLQPQPHNRLFVIGVKNGPWVFSNLVHLLLGWQCLRPCYQLCEAVLRHSGAWSKILTSACLHAHTDNAHILMFSRCNVYHIHRLLLVWYLLISTKHKVQCRLMRRLILQVFAHKAVIPVKYWGKWNFDLMMAEKKSEDHYLSCWKKSHIF